MLFDPLLRDTILGDNRFEEGAKAYAVYYPFVDYERRTYENYGFITMDAIAYHRSNPLMWSRQDKFYDHLVDVTDDLLDDTDPGQVPVIIRVLGNWRYGARGAVVGFQHLPISADTVTLRDCEWGRIRNLVADLEVDLGTDDNWWTG